MSETWEYGEAATPEAGEGFPWPPAANAPILTAFGATWKAATFDPGRFFADTPRDAGTGAAIIYYLAVGILLAGASLFWDSVAVFGGALGQDPLTTELGIQPINPLVRFLLAPAALLLVLFVAAGLIHVILLIFDGARHGFGTTVRVLCYAYSPAIFGVVPVLGTLVGTIWSLVLTIIGLREAHKAAAWKPAVAVLLPFVGAVILGVLFVAMVLFAMGGDLSAG
jgi:hypothetical protein